MRASKNCASLHRAAVLSVALLTLLGARAGYAQNYIYQPNGALSPLWSIAGNWQGGVAPVSGNDTIIQFGESAIETSAGQNIASPFTLNSLRIGSVASVFGPLSISGLPLKFAASSLSALPTLTQNAAKAVTVTSDLQLGATLTISGSGSGPLYLIGTISGSGGLVINRQVTLSKTNSYTGGTTLNANYISGADDSLSNGNIAINGVRLSLNGFKQTAQDLVFNTNGATLLGGTQTTSGNGTLTLNGDMRYDHAFGNGGGQIFFRSDVNLVLGAGDHVLGITNAPRTSPFETTYQIDGVISGAGGLTADGKSALGATDFANEVQLANVNTYRGATKVTGGAKLYLAVGQAIGTAGSPVTVGAGSTLLCQRKDPTNIVFLDQTLGSLAGAGTVTFGDARLTVGANNADSTFSGVLNGTTGSLRKVGKGVFTMSGTSPYTGGTTIQDGTIRLGADNALPINGDVRVAAGTLDLNGRSQSLRNLTFFGGANTLVNSPVVVKGGSLLVSGDILVDRTNQDDAPAPAVQFGSNLVLTAGSHTVTHSDVIGAESNYEIVFGGVVSGAGGWNITEPNVNDFFIAALTNRNTYAGSTTISGRTLLYLGATNALPQYSTVTMAGGGLLLNPNATSDGVIAGNYSQRIGSLSGISGVSLGSANLTTGYDNTNTTFSGGMGGLGGSLTKVGTGVFTLTSGGKTYTGLTNVSGGTLSVNSDISASSGVVVNNGATLGGTGILPAITLKSGGIIAPGNSPGTLSATSLLWNGGGILRFEKGDLLQLSSGFTKGTPGRYFFDFTGGNFSAGDTLDILTFGSTNFQVSDFTFRGLPFGVSGAFTLGDGTLQFSTVAGGVVAAPEPSSLALFAPLLLACAGLSRRKRKS